MTIYIGRRDFITRVTGAAAAWPLAAVPGRLTDPSVAGLRHDGTEQLFLTTPQHA